MHSLKLFLAANKLRQIDLIKYLDVSQPYISQVMSGKMKLSQTLLNKLLNNDQGWDVTPLQEPASTVEDAQTTYQKCSSPEGCEIPRLLPSHIVNSKELDLYEWYQDNCQDAEEIDVEKIAGNSDFAVRVKGDMMYPRIKPDDIIYVQRLGANEKILDNTCYFIDTTAGAFVGFLRVEDDQVLCSGFSGKNVVTLHENEVYGVYRITNQISSYPVRKDDVSIKSLLARLESSDKRTDKLIDETNRLITEVTKAGERVDRALELVAQMCEKLNK